MRRVIAEAAARAAGCIAITSRRLHLCAAAAAAVGRCIGEAPNNCERLGTFGRRHNGCTNGDMSGRAGKARRGRQCEGSKQMPEGDRQPAAEQSRECELGVGGIASIDNRHTCASSQPRQTDPIHARITYSLVVRYACGDEVRNDAEAVRSVSAMRCHRSKGVKFVHFPRKPGVFVLGNACIAAARENGVMVMMMRMRMMRMMRVAGIILVGDF